MADRGEDRAEDLGLQQRHQVDPPRGDRGVEGVPGDSNAANRRRRSRRAGLPAEPSSADAPSDDHEEHALDELLHEADHDVDQRVLLQVRLEQRRSEDPEDAADEERRDELHRADRAGDPFDEKRTTVKGTRKLPSRMIVGTQVGVARVHGDDDRHRPEHEAEEQRLPPPTTAVVRWATGSLAVDMGPSCIVGQRRARIGADLRNVSGA
ncbi:hypothetical protein, partial [Curtobacterium sp. 9128]|uniref:hypothetical protein n=1 Tax=Curtobacterium sp. 9128 TaxID=1793722 RepID=UPI002481F5A9